VDSALTIVDPATPRRRDPVAIGPDANKLRPAAGIRDDSFRDLGETMAMLLSLVSLRQRGRTERHGDGDDGDSYGLHEPRSPRLKFDLIQNRHPLSL
jgi:hypothetical protein